MAKIAKTSGNRNLLGIHPLFAGQTPSKFLKSMDNIPNKLRFPLVLAIFAIFPG
jgi:hypothetical protein